MLTKQKNWTVQCKNINGNTATITRKFKKDEVLTKTKATDYGSKNKPKWNYVRYRHQETVQY